MNKITISLAPVNGGAFNCLPARQIQLDADRVLCNDIVLPGELNPFNTRLWVIGNEHGALGAVWADCEQDALDALVDADLGAALLIDAADEDEDSAHLGNAGKPADLTNVWLQTAVLNPETIKLFTEARDINSSNLAQTVEVKTQTYTLPAYWASYLINGDASGLEDGEQAVIDGWLAKEGNLNIVDCGEQYFSRTNDATSLGGDVCKYTAIVK